MLLAAALPEPTVVATNFSLVLMAIGLAILIISIAKYKVHPLVALIVVGVLNGLAFGIPMIGPVQLPAVGLNAGPVLQGGVIGIITHGFGVTIGNIGIVIILGYMLGTLLEDTGGALVLANTILKAVGRKRSALAMGISGYIVSVPVFSDSAVIIMTPVARSLSARAGVPLVALAGALNAGIMATHTIVPPTPGPLASAATLGADLGMLLLIGLIPAAAYTAAGTWWCTRKFITNKWPEPADMEGLDSNVDENFNITGDKKLPSALWTFACLLVPILLICAQSFGTIWLNDAGVASDAPIRHFLGFFGNAHVALSIGVVMCFFLDISRFSKEQCAKWFSKAIEGSGFVVLATGAAGSYGWILRASGVGEHLGNLIAQTPLPAVVVPFLVTALLSVSNGSATVSLVTGSAIILPLMGPLGLHPVIASLALSSGASFAYHTNATHYWVVVRANKISEQAGFGIVTAGTAIGSVASLIVVWILAMFIGPDAF